MSDSLVLFCSISVHVLDLLQMASGVPLTARALAQSNPNDLQRIANPSLEVNERRLRPIYDYMEIHK